MNLILFEKHEVQNPLPINDPRTVHILKVLHKKAGESFDAGIIDGKRGKAEIISINNTGLNFTLSLFEEAPRRLPVEIGVGFVRPIQLRRILRTLSSAGIKKISFFGTDLGEKSYLNTILFKDGGARAALLEGAEQSRDTLLPELSCYKNADLWISSLNQQNGIRIIADKHDAASSFTNLPKTASGYIIAIGSERGWSERERTIFFNAGFKAFSLGARALRTESAALAAAVIAGLCL
ncbi:MAG: 16S rRNA (uracil(1498)-N(3))-methyltransferase [Spirochaetaceae bacterium]|jgi:RsmE family RNA methyltransferase|nr:16S rRNA (uracil(1498)-N(3))-methyltransferase [Spirochaetaceae bacterium]